MYQRAKGTPSFHIECRQLSGHPLSHCHEFAPVAITDACAGVNLLQESNLIAGLLLNAMFLLGTFTFAVILGVVSDDISSEVKVHL